MGCSDARRDAQAAKCTVIIGVPATSTSPAAAATLRFPQRSSVLGSPLMARTALALDGSFNIGAAHWFARRGFDATVKKL